jgi:hypothetical protein
VLELWTEKPDVMGAMSPCCMEHFLCGICISIACSSLTSIVKETEISPLKEKKRER